jgi:hypothetical protein
MFESRFLLQSAPLQTFSAFSGPRKSPTAAAIRKSGLGVRFRNIPAHRSPNADLTPELESRPFYSTSFFVCGFSACLVSQLESRYPLRLRAPIKRALPTECVSLRLAATSARGRSCLVRPAVADAVYSPTREASSWHRIERRARQPNPPTNYLRGVSQTHAIGQACQLHHR